MRRPLEKHTKYLADSREGLERLIKDDTKGKKVVKIVHDHAPSSVLFGRFSARVTTEFNPWECET